VADIRPIQPFSAAAAPENGAPANSHIMAMPDEEWRRRAQALIQLLDEWSNADEADQQEQRETWEALKQALDEGRPPHLKHFPLGR
jgi:hypothetical protein